MVFRREQRVYAFHCLISTIIEEAVLLAGLLVVLPHFGIQASTSVVVAAALGWAAWSYVRYRLGTSVLFKKPVWGIEAMTGVRCRTVTPLSPDGYVRVGSELWRAWSIRGHIDEDVDAVVVDVKGLIVHVALSPDGGNGTVAGTPGTT